MNIIPIMATQITTMFDHDFMRHAFLALGALAPLCGLLGYFLVIRNEVFAGDALSHVGFTGSLAALALGMNQRFGLFGLSIVASVLIGVLGKRARIGDTAIGVFFMWVLGVGVFCLSVLTTHPNSSRSNAGSNVLFGSVFGISSHRALETAITCLLGFLLLALIARPLLFSSFDGVVARSRGVPVRALTMVFMVIVGITIAEAVQVVGALLLLGMIATPAATVHLLTCRPYAAMFMSAALCTLEAWFGLTLAYVFPALPPSFAIVTVAGVVYFVAVIATKLPSTTVFTRSDKVKTMGV